MGPGLDGWGSFVFKENLKKLKGMLKEWNTNHFGNLDQSIRASREEIQRLDTIDDGGGGLIGVRKGGKE